MSVIELVQAAAAAGTFAGAALAAWFAQKVLTRQTTHAASTREVVDAVNGHHEIGTPRLYDLAASNTERLENTEHKLGVIERRLATVEAHVLP